MAGVNVSSVLDKLDGELIRTRDQGLEDLRYLLASSHNGDNLKGLGDDGFHRILESLYRIARADKSTYLKSAQSYKLKSPSTTKVDTIATALRLTVEAAISKISFKTAISVLDHITGTLLTADGDFFEPFRSDYIKSFRLLLDHGPYGEHLKPKQWQEFVDFALTCIGLSISDDEPENSLSGRDASMRSRSSNNLSMRVSQSSTNKSMRHATKSSLEELLAALRALSSISNAPIMKRAGSILNAVLDSLQSSSRGQDIALEVFNSVAIVSMTEKLDLLVQGVYRLAPLLYRLWSTKATSVRDQVLVTLTIARPLLVTEPHGIAYLEDSLRQKILELLKDDYTERNPREVLQLDDLAVELLNFDSTSHGYRLGPRSDLGRSESSWNLLTTMAYLISGLQTTNLTSSSRENGTASAEDEQPSKRRKLTTPVREILQRATQGTGIDKLASVQILYFVLNEELSQSEETEQAIMQLESSLVNDDPSVVAWVLLLCSRFAWQAPALTVQRTPFWAQMFDHCRRAVFVPSTSRAACLLLDTMLRRDLLPSTTGAVSIQDSLFAGGKNGPAILSDAALMLLASILQSGNVDRDETFEALAMNVIGWLDRHWLLPTGLDRAHNSLLALHGQPEFLCSIISALRGAPLQFETHYRHGKPSALSRFTAIMEEIWPFSSSLAGIETPRSARSKPHVVIREHQLNKETASRVNHAIYDLLQSKSGQFLSAWDVYAKERSSNIGEDVLSIVFSLVLALQANLYRPTLDLGSIHALAQVQQEVWQRILDLLTQRKTDDQAKASLLSSMLLRIQDPETAPSAVLANQYLLYTQSLASIFRQKLRAVDEDEMLDIDMMESTETRASQGTQSGSSGHPIESCRQELPPAVMPNDFPICHLVDLATASAKGASDASVDSDQPSRIIDEVMDLDPGSLLTARQSIYRLVDGGITMTRPDGARLLEHLAKACLQHDDYERSESAMCCCAKVMTSLAPMWTADVDDDLTNHAFDIYGWFITVALAKGFASPEASYDIAIMLDAVSTLAPSYGADEDMPSPRTSLLKILKVAPSFLKYRLSACLTHMFDRFVLTTHGEIFNDIVEALPADPDNVEGIAVRFHVLAELGLRWHTILRQATYHIFETAANVPSLKSLGQQSLHRMCEALKLQSPKELFRAFAPQIFYTWLGSGRIDQIPYEIFGFDSMPDLVTDNVSELVAQIALRGSKRHAEELTSILDIEWTALLDQNFALAEAYCLASQTSLPAEEQLQLNSESLIRKDLGNEVYLRNVYAQLPSIISSLFKALSDDQGVEKAMVKAGLTDAMSTLKRICGHSSSSSTSSSGQQPGFRARYLVEEIKWLCQRVDTDFAQIWSPAVVTFICRQLFQTATSVLGPLASATVVRKLRIIVSLAGRTALSGYPLEMILHNLRPFLTIFQCSEDAIGLYRYLLESGKQHLRAHLSFLAGLGVSIFASLTAFISTSQESTTQESQFVSTMSKAREFRKWLGQHLSALEPDESNGEKVATFRQLIHHAKSMTEIGSSLKSSSEGNVLLRLLLDRMTLKPLLSERDFFLSLGILCRDFATNPDPSDDIATEIRDYAQVYAVLRHILTTLTMPGSFRAWAGYIIGRGCSMIGPTALSTGPVQQGRSASTIGNVLSTSDSYSTIVKNLEGLVWQKDVVTAATAEEFLEQIATTLDRPSALSVLGKGHNQSLLADLNFGNFPCPRPVERAQSSHSVMLLENWAPPADSKLWTSMLVASLCKHLASDPILGALQNFATSAPASAGLLLPYVVHLVLAAELNSAALAKAKVSEVFCEILREAKEDQHDVIKNILDTILYLRRCSRPSETTLAHRNHWLDVDYGDAANAAVACEMWHEALLFVEIQHAQIHLLSSRSTRRSTQTQPETTSIATPLVFENVDDPDFFYAGHEDIDLATVINRLDHESAGFKMLSFQSAAFDAAIRAQSDVEKFGPAASSAARALNTSNLRGISQAVTAFATGQSRTSLRSDANELFLGLYDWSSTSRTGEGPDDSPLKALRALSSAVTQGSLVSSLSVGLQQSVGGLLSLKTNTDHQQRRLFALAILAEARDAMAFKGFQDFDTSLKLSDAINSWSQSEDIEKVIPHLSAREYIFGTIRSNEELRANLALSKAEAFLLEARTVRQAIYVAQLHSATQFSLSRATYLSHLAAQAEQTGLHLQAASQFDIAQTLWSQNEASASVKVLQRLRERDDLKEQDISIDLPEILAELGSKAADARLEPPDAIITHYLMPAYKELGKTLKGSKAGKVFHNFAAFCDSQLQDQDNVDDYNRVAKIRQDKFEELQELERLYKSRETDNRKAVEHAFGKAKTWFKLDDEEFRRVRASREQLILQCLENYLKSMRACDDFPNDALRTISIWLNVPDNALVNKTARELMPQVPSMKFAGLVNQLTSRLIDTDDDFGQTLVELMMRICVDHPYHSMYQLFAASKSKGAEGDEAAEARQKAARTLAEMVRGHKAVGTPIWLPLYNACMTFVRVALVKLSDQQIKTGSKFALKSITHGPALITAVQGQSKKLPPPTMKIALRADRDYSSVPLMNQLESHISVAGGVSAPKIVTVLCTDGSRSKMLLKGGNDDLRQDSIMEQVFEQVSNLLRDHRATRQRKLGIRTYKVVPLTPNAGVIEFVQGTLPLGDYLNPAHIRYFPKDFRPNKCRKDISDAQKHSLTTRVQAYRNVTQNFRPVMRFFFTENFLDPDEWFYKRLNYSRSTAAISILGHVLGLGDRHQHNILLDTNTGEVVHIDLGVAFEAGRILPVPEVVPFRLTRDLVDGMGISGVEGVFRRCCNFTLEALRRDKDDIMTILDVLRYDPLYSWSVSPVRLQKMQENAEQAAAAAAADAKLADGAAPARRKDTSTQSEADRALEVVMKKLGKSLSVEATVNELIRQATDERNLAALYCGWAAYC